MKKMEIAVVLGLICAIFFSDFSGFAQRVKSLQENVLRLHILANSDSDADQELKLEVRDALLAQSDVLFSGCETHEEMRERAEAQKETIRLLAQSVVEAHGSDAQVTVQLVQMEFDEKQYEEITMPAGEYDALRILIGKAQGQNWWCVMYPPLCIPAAADVVADTETAEVFFDEETSELLTEHCRFEIKFKCLEWWDALVEKIS